MLQGSTTRRIAAYTGDRVTGRSDAIAVEAPLEIRVSGRSLSVTMRTPGHDRELAAGFLFTEGVVRARTEIESLETCGAHGGSLDVTLSESARARTKRLERHFYVASSCGVCGKASVDAVRTVHGVDLDDDVRVAASIVRALPDRLRDAQALFDSTGGLHAAGLFDARGALVVAREDVGRHNAVDKVIGERLLAGALPAAGHALVVSGRASFELVQKAAAARIPFLVAVGAPSSLAIELADEVGMTLVGFVRGDRFNVYTGEERIAEGAPS